MKAKMNEFLWYFNYKIKEFEINYKINFKL